MKVNSMVVTSIPHPKTGKDYISASFSVNYQGHTAKIDLEDKRTVVTIDNQESSRVFERSVSLLQLILYIKRACAVL